MSLEHAHEQEYESTDREEGMRKDEAYALKAE